MTTSCEWNLKLIICDFRTLPDCRHKTFAMFRVKDDTIPNFEILGDFNILCGSVLLLLLLISLAHLS